MVNPPKPSAEPQATYSSGRTEGQPDLRILHYNDVYHVDPSSAEPVGGITRFMTACKEYQEDEKYKDQSKLLTFFSGDAFNPSLESTVTKGMFTRKQRPDSRFRFSIGSRQTHGSHSECHWH
jgi:2',3'-cyclic-nucleotide 2'-phosphodiesterase (5'-nucleotidase family)